MKKYSDKKLEQLANDELIRVKSPSYYRELEEAIFKAHDIPFKKSGKDFNDYPCDELVHEELWWDMCELVNDLAQLVLDERTKRSDFMNELKDELKNTIANLNAKRFKNL